jgi:hypothetical protein
MVVWPGPDLGPDRGGTNWEGYQKADDNAGGDSDSCLLVMLRGEDLRVLKRSMGCDGMLVPKLVNKCW